MSEYYDPYDDRSHRCICYLNKRPPCKRCRDRLRAYEEGIRTVGRMASARSGMTDMTPLESRRDSLLRLAEDARKKADKIKKRRTRP